MPTRIMERGTAGPAYRAATCPVITKIPAPMTAPMPSVTRLRGPRARTSECSPLASASARRRAMGLVANRVIQQFWRPSGVLPTVVGRPGLRAGRAALGGSRREQVVAVAAAQGDAGAGLENDDRVAVEPGLQLPHAVQIHERRTADPAEPLGVEPLL